MQLPDSFEVVYTQLQGEVEVGGVFLRLFIAQPNWVRFLEMILGSRPHIDSLTNLFLGFEKTERVPDRNTGEVWSNDPVHGSRCEKQGIGKCLLLSSKFLLSLMFTRRERS